MGQRNHHKKLNLSNLTNRLKSKHLIIAGATVVVLSVGAATAVSLLDRPIVDPVVVNQANFAVYTPDNPPKGFKVVDSQTSLSRGILSFVFANEADNNKLTITVQERPGGFDSAEFTKGGSVNSMTTSNGTLYDLSIANNSQYLLDTGDALVYLTSSNRIDEPAMHALVNDLKKRN